MRHVAWLTATVLLSGCVVAPTAPHAQTNYPAEPAQPAAEVRGEVPTIAGRLSIAHGDVRIWRTDEDGSTDWDDADVNDVITTHSRLRTGPNARAEVRFGPHALRLDDNTELGFTQLDEHHTAVELERGVITARLLDNQFKDTLTVQSGGRSIELRSPGRYRLEGSEGGPLRVTSFRGEAIVFAGGNTLSLREGRSLDVSPDGTRLNYGDAVATAFDEWSLQRDERLREAAAATRYVSPYMTGYEELNAYGDWVYDGTYGNVWVPRTVVAGWAPYRHGRWRWVAPWGWTWVDEAPWGFAPFHYGRWVYAGARWCWWPGAYVARPVYAPALVGWVGSPGWNVSVSVGSPGYVGWYPLAPWHAYRPRYVTNVQYHASLNQNIIRAPAGVSVNSNLERGGTAVPGRGFRDPIRRGGQPIDRVASVREVLPVAPPSRIGRGPGDQAPPRNNDAPPRPQFDRDIRQPDRNVGQPQQQPPQQQPGQPWWRGGQPQDQNGGRTGVPRSQPVPDPRAQQQPESAGWRRQRHDGTPFPDRSEPVMNQPRPQAQQPQQQPSPQQTPRGNPINTVWPAPQQQQQQAQPPQGWRSNGLPQQPPAVQQQAQPQQPQQQPHWRAPHPQAQVQQQAQPQPAQQQQQQQPQQQRDTDKDNGQRGLRGEQMRR